MVFENLAEQAFRELFPEKRLIYSFEIRFSAKFRDFNANIALKTFHKVITFSLSSEWKEVDEDIIKGLMQYLLAKLFAKKNGDKIEPTLSMRLYEGFLENIGKYVASNDHDPILEDSFDRMNLLYFDGLLEKPNLIWGGTNKRKMGHYDYQRDTIMISQTLRERMDLVDFVMFHEMLHKKHQYYKTDTGRRMHHHTAFREDEKQYPGFDALEKELAKHAHSFRVKKKPTKKKSLAKKWFDIF